MTDLFGKALLDYQNGNYTEDILTATNISDKDVLPLPYLFGDFTEMPKLEQIALQHCIGKTLNVACGAGSHSLWLQNQGHTVTAIDVSQGAVEVARLRGLHRVIQTDLLGVGEETYETILIIMNGTRVFETVAKTSSYLQKLKRILDADGQILIDSSDLQYMYDRNEDGSIWVPANRYYGELECTLTYKGETTQEFPWLYLDERRFQELAEAEGLTFEIISRGDNFDYLARLTVADDTL